MTEKTQLALNLDQFLKNNVMPEFNTFCQNFVHIKNALGSDSIAKLAMEALDQRCSKSRDGLNKLLDMSLGLRDEPEYIYNRSRYLSDMNKQMDEASCFISSVSHSLEEISEKSVKDSMMMLAIEQLKNQHELFRTKCWAYNSLIYTERNSIEKQIKERA